MPPHDGCGDQDDEQSWREYRRHVIAELGRISSGQHEIRKVVFALQLEMAILKTKAATWGAAGAGVVTLIGIVIEWLHKS